LKNLTEPVSKAEAAREEAVGTAASIAENQGTARPRPGRGKFEGTVWARNDGGPDRIAGELEKSERPGRSRVITMFRSKNGRRLFAEGGNPCPGTGLRLLELEEITIS